MGNQPRTHTRSPGATFMSSLVYSLSTCAGWQRERAERSDLVFKRSLANYGKVRVLTCGLSDTYLAQWRMSRMASMLVSGKAALHTNSERHFTASWNESIAAAKCCWNVFTKEKMSGKTIRTFKPLWLNTSSTSSLALLRSLRWGVADTHWRCVLWFGKQVQLWSHRGLMLPGGTQRRCSSSLSGC